MRRVQKTKKQMVASLVEGIRKKCGIIAPTTPGLHRNSARTARVSITPLSQCQPFVSLLLHTARSELGFLPRQSGILGYISPAGKSSTKDRFYKLPPDPSATKLLPHLPLPPPSLFSEGFARVTEGTGAVTTATALEKTMLLLSSSNPIQRRSTSKQP